jgi:peptide/nickel transport system permease protein
MLAFVVRRVFQSIIVMIVVALIAFLLFRFVGDPVNQMVGIETTPEEREALRTRLGLNDPILLQF